MSLSKIREENILKNSFINDSIDYSMLSPEVVEMVRENTFEAFVKPINYNTLNKND